jgi:hypothetical protein
MSSRLILACALAGVVIVVAGCDNGGSLATSSQTQVTFTGRLVGGKSSGADPVDCAWLDDVSGRRVVVFYPDGWDVEFHPVRLVDASGDVIARDGDTVRITGPGGGIGASLCSSESPFVAQTVEKLP